MRLSSLLFALSLVAVAQSLRGTTPPPPSIYACFAVSFDRSSTAHIISRTKDAGASWETILNSTVGINDIDCVSPADCMAVGGTGEVIVTNDGGRSWNTTATLAVSLLQVDCITSTTCFAVGWVTAQGPVIANTIDGGANWALTSQNFPPSAFLSDIYCQNASYCVVVGYTNQGALAGVILTTSDGGSTWTSPLAGKQVDSLQSIDCVGDNCVAVGTWVALSTNSGADWHAAPVAPDPSPFFISVDCVGTACYTVDVSINDTVLRSDDAGNTWTATSLQVTEQAAMLGGVACVSQSTCLVAGTANNRGVVYQTADSGSTWHESTVLQGNYTILSLGCPEW